MTLTLTTSRYLVLHLVDQQLVMLPIDQLAEVFNLPLIQIVPIPDVPAVVMGVCNWRGEVTWVVDLGYLLGFAPLFQKGFSQTVYKVVLLQVDNQYVGLAVPKIGEMLNCSDQQIQEGGFSHINSNLARCLRGYFLNGDRQMVLALDGHALIQLLGGN
jgi:Chemotaxis signal transduction protein